MLRRIDLTYSFFNRVDLGAAVCRSDILVMTNEAARVFLVPAQTASIRASIVQAALTETNVDAYTQGKVATSGLGAEDYVVYAIDSAGNISVPSKLITIQNPVSAALISDVSGIKILYRATDKLIIVKSKNEPVLINLHDITGVVTKQLLKEYD